MEAAHSTYTLVLSGCYCCEQGFKKIAGNPERLYNKGIIFIEAVHTSSCKQEHIPERLPISPSCPPAGAGIEPALFCHSILLSYPALAGKGFEPLTYRLMVETTYWCKSIQPVTTAALWCLLKHTSGLHFNMPISILPLSKSFIPYRKICLRTFVCLYKPSTILCNLFAQ